GYGRALVRDLRARLREVAVVVAAEHEVERRQRRQGSDGEQRRAEALSAALGKLRRGEQADAGAEGGACGDHEGELGNGQTQLFFHEDLRSGSDTSLGGEGPQDACQMRGGLKEPSCSRSPPASGSAPRCCRRCRASPRRSETTPTRRPRWPGRGPV